MALGLNVRLTRLSVENVRSLDRLSIEIEEGINVFLGPNGTGKTTVIESIYFALTGRSCRTNNVREIIKHGQQYFRIELDLYINEKKKVIKATLDRAMKKVHLLNENSIDSSISGVLPSVAAFVPDKLEVVKGGPGIRRAHLDTFADALCPAYGDVRSGYARVLAQRNALIAWSSDAKESSVWDSQLSQKALDLTSMRRKALERVGIIFSKYANNLGLDGDTKATYRPSTMFESKEEYERHFAENINQDIARGFTTTGPHRDDFKLQFNNKDIRKYGSRGEQRIALLALLLAERDVIKTENNCEYILLLDDVLSELDYSRRQLLVKELASDGQSIITTVSSSEVPEGTKYQAHDMENLKHYNSGSICISDRSLDGCPEKHTLRHPERPEGVRDLASLLSNKPDSSPPRGSE